MLGRLREMVNQRVYNKLIEVALKSSYITYSDLNSECDLNLDFNNINDRNKISKILGEISLKEVKKGRPMLSSLVILKGTVPIKPAFGFFTYADELGIRKPNEKDNALFYRQLKACWEYWKKDNGGVKAK